MSDKVSGDKTTYQKKQQKKPQKNNIKKSQKIL